MSSNSFENNTSNISGSEEPIVIDSVTSTVTPEQAFESVDLTDPSVFIKTSNQSSNMIGGAKTSVSSSGAKSGAKSGSKSEPGASGTEYVTTDTGSESLTSDSAVSLDQTPDYYIYLDYKNALLFKELLFTFLKMKSDLQARSMVNMEPLNPESSQESADNHLAKLMAQALTLLKKENSDEKNQIMSLYTYYAERAKSFMFFQISDIIRGHGDIICTLESTKTGALVDNCRIAGIDNDLYLSIEIKVDASNPKNTTGEDVISYVGVSPHTSIRGKGDGDTDGDAEAVHTESSPERETGVVPEARVDDLVDRTRELAEKFDTPANVTAPFNVAGQDPVPMLGKSTSPEKASFFNADATESGKGEQSIPHLTSTRSESEPKGNNISNVGVLGLKDRIKGMIEGYGQKGGDGNDDVSDSSGTPSPSDSSTNTSISSSDSSNIIMLGGAHISPGAPQTEVDVRLRELLDQSKPGKRGRFESTSSPMAGLCE
jgi:hypothetical protein